jgi:choline dehydrogenase-like flavoprotein
MTQREFDHLLLELTAARCSRRAFLGTAAALSALALVRPGKALPVSSTSVSDGELFDAEQWEVLRQAVVRILAPAEEWPDPLELGVPEAIAEAIRHSDPKVRKDFQKLLSTLGSRMVALLFDLRFTPFAKMTPEDQTAYLRDWMTSWMPQRRAGFQALKRLATFAYYTHPQVWPSIDYGGPWGNFPTDPDPIQVVTPRPDENIEADVCVIGSGAGGAVVAAELARAGMNVVVLEMGGYYSKLDFNQKERDMVPKLFMKRGLLTTEDLSVVILAGECLGGSTTVNWTTSMRISEPVLSQWRQASGLQDLTMEVLAPSFQAVEERLHVQPVPDEDHNPNNSILLRGAPKAGYHVGVISRNAVSDVGLAERFGVELCIQCGFCGVGCAYDAKLSTLITYLRDAYAAGARLYTDCKAERIEVGANGRKIVMGRYASKESDESWGFRVSAPVVVVAGGSIQSPALLLRSRIANGSGAVGRFLSLHVTTAVLGLYDERIDMSYGIPQSAYSKHFDDNLNGFWIEAVPGYPGLAAMALPELGEAHRSLMAQYPHAGGLIVLVRDRSSGSVEIDDRGEPVVHYSVASVDEKTMLAGIKAAARIHFAAGARQVMSLHARLTAASRDTDSDPDRALAAFFEAVDHQGVAPNALGLFSAHPMGTCRMGADPSSSVVNGFCESHEVPGLFVCDGSVFPLSAGINPMLTIMAIAHRSALHIAEERQKYGV